MHTILINLSHSKTKQSTNANQNTDTQVFLYVLRAVHKERLESRPSLGT